MDALDALLGEYNNLWQEKVAHKQSIRKLKGYLSYLTSNIIPRSDIYGLIDYRYLQNGFKMITAQPL